MIVMFNGRAMDSDRVTMQHLHRVNMMYLIMLHHTQILNISVVHKQVKVEMEDGSKPLQKFTDLCQEFMLLTARAIEGIKELSYLMQ
jgi:hypothetical protein